MCICLFIIRSNYKGEKKRKKKIEVEQRDRIRRGKGARTVFY